MPQCEIETKPLSELIPAPYNPRTITEAAMRGLKASIERFGLVQPIVFNRRTGHVVGGHQRVKALQAAGETEAQCVIVDLPETEEKALNLTLNNPAIAGEFTEGVFSLLDDIKVEVPDLYENLLLDDIAVHFPEFEQVGNGKYGDADLDEIPEAPEPVTQPGDLWMLGNHRLVCGDATDADRVAYLMQGRKADMVFTDPPYNVDYGSSKNPRHKYRTIENDKQSPSEWLDFCRVFLLAIKQYCPGDIYIFGAPGPEGMRQRLLACEIGFHWSATIIWKKQQLVLTPANYQRMYEPCLYGWFGKSTFGDDRTQTEVWEIDRPHKSELCPTQKPVELCMRAITNSSKHNDIVLDLFGGSGSTLIACEQLNRTCYMMEIDPHYCDVIVKRWEDLTGNKAIRQPCCEAVAANG
ncbi:MAG: DNA modification methylase [bacterium]